MGGFGWSGADSRGNGSHCGLDIYHMLHRIQTSCHCSRSTLLHPDGESPTTDSVEWPDNDSVEWPDNHPTD